MRIEVLHISDCANWQEAANRAWIALEKATVSGARVTTRLVQTPAEALESGFAGSPTVLIDGVDAFPSDGHTIELACRVYATSTGIAPFPTVEQLLAVIRERVAG